MLVSMMRDGVAQPHAGREREDAGAMSDGGLIEAVASTRNSKPGSLSFAPTPILVHHSAHRLQDIQASSSGDALSVSYHLLLKVASFQIEIVAVYSRNSM